MELYLSTSLHSVKNTYSTVWSINKMSCVVPGCTSNYRGEDFTKIFNFPKDEVLREKWFIAIPRPREDYQNNKIPRVSNSYIIPPLIFQRNSYSVTIIIELQVLIMQSEPR